MPTFRAPQYTKLTNPKTGAQEPSYTFAIDFKEDEHMLTFIADSAADITIQSLQKSVVDDIAWWNNFITQFLQASSKLFSKQYTVENINKITKHTLDGSKGDSFPANVTFVPKNIQIFGGAFTVNWGFVIEPVIIDIPDLGGCENDSEQAGGLPATNAVIDGMEELNIDELPVGGNSTEELLELDSPAKFYEKQKVKEARLKAKLALYKAQRQMAQYYEKYGDDISDTDSEFETSDEESGEDSGEEEVQL